MAASLSAGAPFELNSQRGARAQEIRSPQSRSASVSALASRRRLLAQVQSARVGGGTRFRESRRAPSSRASGRQTHTQRARRRRALERRRRPMCPIGSRGDCRRMRARLAGPRRAACPRLIRFGLQNEPPPRRAGGGAEMGADLLRKRRSVREQQVCTAASWWPGVRRSGKARGCGSGDSPGRAPGELRVVFADRRAWLWRRWAPLMAGRRLSWRRWGLSELAGRLSRGSKRAGRVSGGQAGRCGIRASPEAQRRRRAARAAHTCPAAVGAAGLARPRELFRTLASPVGRARQSWLPTSASRPTGA